MAAIEKHIRRIVDAWVNRTGLDDGQTMILTDPEYNYAHIWKRLTKYIFPAVSKYTVNGSTWTYCDTEFNDVSSYGNIKVAEYIGNLTDSTTNITIGTDSLLFYLNGTVNINVGGYSGTTTFPLGKVAIGTADPEAWGTDISILQLGTCSTFAAYTANDDPYNILALNLYLDAYGYKRIENLPVCFSDMYAGEFKWYSDTADTADAIFTPTLRMILNTNGMIGLGTDSPTSIIEIFQSGCPSPYPYLTFRSNIIAHGITNYATTDTIFTIYNSDGNGGVFLTGFSVSEATTPLVLQGFIGVTCPSTVNDGAVSILGGLKDNLGIKAMTANDVVLNILNDTTSILKIRGNGCLGLNMYPLAYLDIQGTGDLTYSNFRDTNIAHGVTTILSTDSFFTIKEGAQYVGGIKLIGATTDYNDSTLSPFQFLSVDGKTCTSSTASFEFVGAQKNGTGITDVETTEKIFKISNHEASLFNLYGDGTLDLPKVRMTPEGGIAVKLTNKTGGASVKGEVVTVYDTSAINNAVKKIVVDIPTPIGVFYETGVADGSEAWIVTMGIAEVYFIGNTTIGHLARGFLTADGGYVAGQALSEAAPGTPFATDKHFYEIGHVLESRVGAGLAKVNLHFN